MIDAHLSFGKFLAAWAPAAAISVAADPVPRLADAFLIDFGGVPVPSVTCALGALGVLLARPLARRQESQLGWLSYAVVSVILLLAAEVWIIDSRPPALFALVVSIGLGFSGFSLIELAGTEAIAVFRRLIPGLAPASPVPPSSAPSSAAPATEQEDKHP